MPNPPVLDPREEIDAELSDLPGSENFSQDEELENLWVKPPVASGLNVDETRMIRAVCLRSHKVISGLCRKHYGDSVEDWPDDAKEILTTLSIWGCHE
jgi:hypothetical protein